MGEYYLDAEEMIPIWIEQLLFAHGVDDEDELTPAQIETEIAEEEANLRNERMWNIGNNVEVHEAYLAYLQELLSNKQEELE